MITITPDSRIPLIDAFQMTKMNIENRLNAFIKLGELLKDLPQYDIEWLERGAGAENGWFDEKSITQSIKGIVHLLDASSLKAWAKAYNIPAENKAPKRVLVVMAGNIPLVGFHDILTTLISGNILLAKLSSQDTFLVKWILSELKKIEPAFADYIQIMEGSSKEIEAVIATGSDNSARYFEQYFGKYPNIIRKNRSSIAVIKGDETIEELAQLKDDVLMYYGLGCRNISKVFIPQGYDITQLIKALEPFIAEVMVHHKYNNNYDYNKSIYLVNNEPHLDNGGLIFRESNDMVSPISVLFYEQYKGEAELQERLSALNEKLQCVVSNNSWVTDSYNFGKAQLPNIDDYADGVDTMKFLLAL